MITRSTLRFATLVGGMSVFVIAALLAGFLSAKQMSANFSAGFSGTM
jgi:hypothetical protein